MLILLTVLFLGLVLLGAEKDWDEDVVIFFLCGFILFFIITCFNGIVVINGRTLDSKIEMYTEENTKIENEMNVLVEQYMNYESSTYGELKGDSSITLVSLYPELKADTLVSKQLEVYLSNNEKIKKFKERKIDLTNTRWWLYFGK